MRTAPQSRSRSSVTRHERMMPTRYCVGSRPSARSAAAQASSEGARGPCGSRFAPARTARRPPARLRHGGDPERWPAGLHVTRRDPDVLEFVALAGKAELLAGEGAPQHGDAFIGQGDTARDRQAEAAELVRRVTHAHADLDPSAADIVEHREILGEPDRVVEWC